MAVARLFQRAADEADVVARAAAAARLRHHEGKVIGVVAARGHRLHELADHRDGREAGVVVDVLEPHVDGAAVVVVEHDHAVSVPPEHRLEHVEVDGAHLRREDRIARLCRLHSISESAAEEKMNKADKRRAEYYNYYSYKTWGAAATYHLCVDSSVLGIDETVGYIEEFVRKKLKLYE